MTNLYILLVFMIHLVYFVKPECESINASTPTFSKKMLYDTPIIRGRDTDLLCCIYGVTQIIWSCKTKASMNKWSIIDANKGLFGLSTDNRTLTFKNPTRFKHAGRYKCEGTNDRGQSDYGLRKVVVLGSTDNSSFRLIDWSRANPLIYKPMSTHTLFCVATVYLAFTPIFKWYTLPNKKPRMIIKGGSVYFNRKYRNLTYGLIEGLKGSSQISISPVKYGYNTYNFTLTLSSLEKSNEGLYRCSINDGRATIEREFGLYLEKPHQLPISTLIGIFAFFTMAVICLYIFRYNITIVIKNILRLAVYKNYNLKKYHFFFVYNFDDNEEYKVIQDIVNYLEVYGYSSYLFHRDQTYGHDRLQDIATNIKKSHMVVMWASASFFDSQINRFCMQMLIKNFGNLKQIFVSTTAKNQTLTNYRRNSVVTDSWFSSKIFHLEPSTNIAGFKLSMCTQWNNYQCISWLISCLPVQL